MEQIVRDWTKYIVPIRRKNIDVIRGNYDPRNDTTDFIALPSANGMRDRTSKSLRKDPTDFSVLGGGVGCTKSHGAYFLRSGSPLLSSNCVDVVDTKGGISKERTDSDSCGICPIFTLRLPRKMPPQLAKLWLGDIDTVNIDGDEYFRLYIGEFPRTKVSNELEEKLENFFKGFDPKGLLKCTGRLYELSNYSKSSGTEDSLDERYHRLCPEYEYEGQKYVRVRSNQKKGFPCGDRKLVRNEYPAWIKVEPVRLIVKNSDEFALGQTNELQLEAEEIVASGIPFYPDRMDENSYYWQNSMVRAYLNSAQTADLDGNPDKRTETNWDFRNGGFLQSAFNMTREPTLEYRIPKHQTQITDHEFECCDGLQKIIIPDHVTNIDSRAFVGVKNAQIVFEGINPDLHISQYNFGGSQYMKYVYVSKDGNSVILSKWEDRELDKTHFKLVDDELGLYWFKIFNENFRKNFAQASSWKESGKVKFIPPDYTLKTFPASEFEKYFINNNNQRWARLVKSLGQDTLVQYEEANTLVDLMKIYYAIGGFSANQGESERAFDYVLNYVPSDDYYEDADPDTLASDRGQELHQRFSGLILNGPYNPTFASFFMKYYKDNPDFMEFFEPESLEYVDYLCSAHNNFNYILEKFPNMVVNGNEERSLLTPRFVADHCFDEEYEQVDEGNEELAQMCSKYAYSAVEFARIQKVFNKAKKIKKYAKIYAETAKGTKGITFRVLEKDDPLGFVIGNITNCCQKFGDSAESCVEDGYVNPYAGFIVFEQELFDKNGKPTDEKRILGQAYVWYDPETKTVCYDNIEIPTKVLNELRKGEKHGDDFSSNALLDVVVESADAIMTAMNKRGIAVERVTTGEGYNDLVKDLKQRFGDPEKPPKSMHRDYSGYSDAKSAQYIIRNYDETTKYYADSATAKAGAIKKDIADIKSATQHATENAQGESAPTSDL